MKKLALLFFILPSLSFGGDLFQITNRTGDCSSTLICDALEIAINSSLPDASAINFLPAMGDANVLANKGIGADYASNMTLFAVSASGGFGADVGDAGGIGDLLGGSGGTLPAFGLAATAMVGMNLGTFLKSDFFNRSNVFVNFFSYEMSSGATTGDLSNFGVHYQYKLMAPQGVGAGSLLWGGLDLTVGLETSSTKIITVQSFNQTVNDGTGTATYSGLANVGVDVSTTSIPIELTTNVRALYVFTLYGGFGFDINSGTSKSIASAPGTVSLGGGYAGSGTSNLNLGTESSPSSTYLRSIFGVQLNVTALKLFAETSSVFGENKTSAHLGLRVVW